MHRNKLLKLLKVYERKYSEESATVHRFEEFVRNHERCFERDCWAGHVTGSAWLVNRTMSHVLLTHHKKLNKWLQLGGHSDGDCEMIQKRRIIVTGGTGGVGAQSCAGAGKCIRYGYS